MAKAGAWAASMHQIAVTVAPGNLGMEHGLLFDECDSELSLENLHDKTRTTYHNVSRA